MKKSIFKIVLTIVVLCYVVIMVGVTVYVPYDYVNVKSNDLKPIDIIRSGYKYFWKIKSYKRYGYQLYQEKINTQKLIFEYIVVTLVFGGFIAVIIINKSKNK
jgi:hypothetical protein